MEDDLDAPEDFDVDGNVDIKTDGDDDEEEDEQVEKEEEDDEEEDEEEDGDEDDGKYPRTISEGEMVHTSANDVVTMVDNQLIVLQEQGQETCKHTPQQ
jgi:hypothetical protein